MKSAPSRRSRKSWREKLADAKGLPRLCPMRGKLRRQWGSGTMLIPAPIDVDAQIRRIRKGRMATINDLRTALARTHAADVCCPLTTGIFAWIAAHAAAEAEAAGRKRITPWWRVLKAGMKLNPKFPGGLAEQARRLTAEGHQIVHGRVVH